MNKKDFGKTGEQRAIKYLKDSGYKIVEENYRSRFGEIDIIATNAEYIVFVEVKARTNTQYGLPCQAVDYRKQIKIGKIASMYIELHNIKNLGCRFDIIEILYNFGMIDISHIENAFQPQII